MTHDPPELAAKASGTISATGTGSVRASPDRILLTIALDRTNQQVDQVERQLTEDRRTVLAALGSAAVPEERIRTLGMQISPMYEWEDRRHVFRGFRGTERILVRVPLEVGRSNRLVRALSQALEYVHLRIDHILRDPAEVQRHALEAAVCDARLRAETIACAAGGRLGPLLSYCDGAAARDEGWPAGTGILQSAVGEAGETIAAADHEIHATITGVWQVEPGGYADAGSPAS